MRIADNSSLGIGIYSPREAARYVRAKHGRLRRWMYGNRSVGPVFDPQIPRDGGLELVTFIDFAQALRVQEIRLNVGVPLQRIREAYETARREHGIAHPFATENFRVLVFGNHSEPHKCALVLCEDKYVKDEDFLEENAQKYVQKHVQLTGKKKGNVLISEVVQKFSTNLWYEASGVAGGYEAFKHKNHRILIDPAIRFGKPYVENTCFESETLAEAAEYEGGIERAADLFDVEPSVVEVSVLYHQYLRDDPPKIEPKKIETIVA